MNYWEIFTCGAARFSPDDKYSRQRYLLKKRFGLLPTQKPAPKYWSFNCPTMDVQEKIICFTACWLECRLAIWEKKSNTARRYHGISQHIRTLCNAMLFTDRASYCYVTLSVDSCLYSYYSTHGLDCYGNLYFLGYQEYKAASLGLWKRSQCSSRLRVFPCWWVILGHLVL
jgi:hypothetical protein